MTYFIASYTAIENTRALAQSALPDAPVVPDDERPPSRSRRILGRLFSRPHSPAKPRRLTADSMGPSTTTRIAPAEQSVTCRQRDDSEPSAAA